jgi:hypothetical protein
MFTVHHTQQAGMDLGSSILLTSHKVAALNRKKERKKGTIFYLCREEGKKLSRNLTEILTHLVFDHLKARDQHACDSFC